MDEPKTLEEQQNEYYMALGQCITQWAYVEETLFFICQDILGTAHQHTAIIFYKTPTLDTRVKLCDELIPTLFPKPDDPSKQHKAKEERKWRDICSSIEREIKVRNRIAHEPVGPFLIHMVEGTTTMGGIRFHSYTPLQKQVLSKHKNNEPLPIAGLYRHFGAVGVIQRDLTDLHAELRAHIAEHFPQNVRPWWDLDQ